VVKKVKSLNRSIVESSGETVISNRQRAKKIDLRFLRRIVAELLKELKIDCADLEINLVGAAEMAEINWQFLRHEGSTDVITFNYSNSEFGIRNSEFKSQGEIFICVDEAILQAKKFKTNWQSEIVRYVIHGVLHLLGDDDLHAAARKKMKREENRLLRELSKRFSLAQLSPRAKLGA